MKIDEIALKVAKEAFCCQFTALPVPEHRIKAFAHALLAELSKQEPVGYVDYGDRVEWYNKPAPETDLFTHQLPTAEIEQRLQDEQHKVKVLVELVETANSGVTGAHSVMWQRKAKEALATVKEE